MSPYWLAFRKAGKKAVELHGEHTGWKDDSIDEESLNELLAERHKEHANEDAPRNDAIRRIRIYQQMRIVGVYACAGGSEPIELRTYSGGPSGKRPPVMIEGTPWIFDHLDGNHRLMAAVYLGIQRVPVTLKEVEPDWRELGVTQ